ncbi:hypothetical protein GCM10011386_03000 [Parapedobacter defluvii]|uniref:Uncharacterized protein n=1 Tax=Parapedobacter defluvii TaxID=2045106 RepID=A0ABQ1L156_9SPHI|nr:hypothetical protein GCM10011386_03000 [Parapedobacter defluvii]
MEPTYICWLVDLGSVDRNKRGVNDLSKGQSMVVKRKFCFIYIFDLDVRIELTNAASYNNQTGLFATL